MGFACLDHGSILSSTLSEKPFDLGTKKGLMRQPRDIEEPFHRGLVCLQRTVRKDVFHNHAPINQRASHKKPTVTIERVLLRAQQRDAVVIRATDDTLDAASERLRACQSPEDDTPALIT